MRTRSSLGVVAMLAVLNVPSAAHAQNFPLLYTVTDANVLAAVDVGNACSATLIGVTQDAVSPFTVRRIRGLAYDPGNDIMYGMTREGDLVTVDRSTGATTHVLQLPCGSPSTEFWGGLAFDGANKLYTTNAFDQHELAEITLGITPSATCNGSTILNATSLALQILGVALYPSSAPAVPPTFNGTHPSSSDLYASNRSNDNIAVVDKGTAVVTFPMGNHTVGVNNLQAITFHPLTGVLYAIHDHYSQSNNAALSTYDFSTEMATELCELPFGIVENVGGGNDTYGWGGLAFGPFSQTLTAGGCDAFAGSTEATNRNPAITSFYAPTPFKDFDDPAGETWLTHTFTGLPSPLCGCTLTLIARTVNNLSYNDVVSLVFNGSGFAYGQGFTNIPTVGSGWVNPSARTLTMDCAALPAATPSSTTAPPVDLRSMIAGSLDVAIEDDTELDCMTLTVTPCGPMMANSCGALKTVCVAKKTCAKLTCHEQAERKGVPVDPLCLAKAESAFDACFAKADSKQNPAKPRTICPGGGGNAGAMKAKVDAFITDVVSELDPAFPTPVLSKCSAGKKKCVCKKASGLLKCHAKAEKKGLRPFLEPTVLACMAKVRAKFTACFDKLDAKQVAGKPETLCPGGTGDAAAMEAKVDAFVDDVVCELDPGSGTCP